MGGGDGILTFKPIVKMVEMVCDHVTLLTNRRNGFDAISRLVFGRKGKCQPPVILGDSYLEQGHTRQYELTKEYAHYVEDNMDTLLLKDRLYRGSGPPS